jgi:hypothetical protein
MMSLLHNPVVTRRNYREYVIHKFPNLRVRQSVPTATTWRFAHLNIHRDPDPHFFGPLTFFVTRTLDRTLLYYGRLYKIVL